MDAVTFNSSSSLPDVVGGTMCRITDSSSSSSSSSSGGDKPGQQKQSALALLIGGVRNSRLDAGDDYLRMDVLNVPTANWSPEYVVTNKARNRAYHSVAVVNLAAVPSDQAERGEVAQVALLFGGGVLARSPSSSVPMLQPVGEVLQISRSLFGFKVNSIYADEGCKLAFMGLSASTMGKDNDRVVIFGGCDPVQSRFNSEVHLFTIHERQPQLKPVEIDPTLPQPPPRAYHSAVVLGDQNQYLLILGGEDARKEALADCWLLDMSDVLAAEYNPEPVPADANPKDAKKAPPPKGGKDAGKPPVYARWISVPAATPIPDPHTPEGQEPRHLDFNTARSRFQTLAIPQASSTSSLECELWLCGGLVKEGSGLMAAAMGNMPRCQLRVSLPASRLAAAAAPAGGKNAAPPPTQGPQATLTPLPPVLASSLPTVVQANEILSLGGSSSSPPVHTSVRTLCAYASTRAVALSACPVFPSDFEGGDSPGASPVGFLLTGGRLREGPSSSSSSSSSSGCPASVVLVTAASASPAFLQRAKRAIQRNYLREGHPIRKDATHSAHDTEGKLTQRRIDFLSGDVYQGTTATVQTSLPASPALASHGGGSASLGNRGEDEAKTDGTDEAATVLTEDIDEGGGLRLQDVGAELEEDGPAVVEEDSGRGVEGLHIPHGSGRMDYQAGGHYEGDWRDGQRAGQGRWVHANGDEYEGDFVHDNPHGVGVHKTVSPPAEYSGDFAHGQYHGMGEWRSLDQRQVFRGHFAHGRRHGDGVLSFLDEDGAQVGEMVGTWQHDEMVGVGQANNYSISSLNLRLGYFPREKLFLEEQAVNSVAARQAVQAAAMLPHLAARLPGAYWGPAANGQPHGDQGRCVYASGDEYVGQWKKGRRNGLGVYRFANGDTYDGKWVGDVPCGFGRFWTLLGDAYEGQWENNAYHGQGVLVSKREGRVFAGQFVRGRKHGEGRVLEDGTQKVVEEGQYRNDKYIGRC